MNLMYEEYPTTIRVTGKDIKILTDFRDCILLMDLLKDQEIELVEKIECISQYILSDSGEYDFREAIDQYCDFLLMRDMKSNQYNDVLKVEKEDNQPRKNLFSFSIDYPFIFSAFLHDYGINIRTVPYMHWWEFRMLFDGLSEDTEIKQRIRYRGIDLNSIKDNEERKRVAKIQRAIMLPEEVLTDYDIGDVLW